MTGHTSWCADRAHGPFSSCRDAHAANKPQGGHPMTPEQIAEKLAQELRLTRLATMQIVTRQAGYPGLQGISPKAGAQSVEAILTDFTRTVAHVLAEAVPGFSYAAFMNPPEVTK